MNTLLRIILMSILAISVACCGLLPSFGPGSSPPTGWRDPVYKLLIDDASFPEGWQVLFPEDTSTDRTVNKVYRTWGRVGIPGKAIQVIWRAYTIADAEEKYDELQSQYTPTPSPFGHTFIPFEPPDEIEFRSRLADEFRLGCGWYGIPYCLANARYRNYVVDLTIDLEVEDIDSPGNYSNGLTYEEI